MFAAGETFTTVVSIAAAAYASRAHTPGGHALLAGEHRVGDRRHDHDRHRAQGRLRQGAARPRLA